MNQELKNKTVTLAAIELMYMWTFKKRHPDTLAFSSALAAVRRKLDHDQFIEFADNANAIVERGLDSYMNELNKAAN